MTERSCSRFIFILILVTSLFGCSPQNREITPTKTAVSSETPTKIPTSTPSPTLPPVYSSFPAISEVNATRVVNINKYPGGVDSVAFSPNGKYLAATLKNGIGIIWDISAAKGWEQWESAPKDVFVSNGQVSFSSDSNILATGGTLLEIPSKKVLQALKGTVVFNSVNPTFALFDLSNLSIWNQSENQSEVNLKQDSPGVVSVAFSPDGNLLGEALRMGSGEGVNVWKVSDHTLLYSFPPIEHNHSAHFNTLAYAFFAFSPDNQYIVTGTKDFPYKTRIWNLQTGKLVKDLDISADCIAFSQDAKVIILTEGNRITFRTFPEGNVIGELKVEIYYMSPTDYVTACTTSKDGKLLAIGDSGGTVNIWAVPAYLP